MDEASILIIARMRDEASAEMSGLGTTTRRTQSDMQTFRMTMLTVGSALTSVGALIGRIDSPQAKMASNFFLIAGAVAHTASALTRIIPTITKLTASLRSLALIQSIVSALSGPAGWALLGAGVIAGGIGTAAIMRSSGSSATTNVTNYNIGGSIVTEREVGQLSRREIIKDQGRNSSSGIR